MSVAPHPLPAGDETVLAARNISKSYGNIHALKRVNFDIHRGKVTTLFGENGAGKSTLMKVLSGVVTPSSGDIELDGARVSFHSSTDARDRGISIIHQELSLAPNLSVRDNIFMGRELRTPTGIDFAEEARQVRKLMADLHEDIDPLTLVEDLRLGQQQIVEIARALSVDSRILIMDEPTSALSAAEVEILFPIIWKKRFRSPTMPSCCATGRLRPRPRRRTSISNGLSATWWARTSTSARRLPAINSARSRCRSTA
jgi:erythritol transport system ATP-binding protein